MTRSPTLFLLALGLALTLVACGSQTSPFSKEQATDIAWQALAANTSSQDRAAWQVVQAREVKGQEVVDEFEGQASFGCWMGPTPEPNGAIRPSGRYWYIEMSPRPATPLPQKGEVSPTAPPLIPEPFLRQAFLLVDAADGQVVARKLYCVIY